MNQLIPSNSEPQQIHSTNNWHPLSSTQRGLWLAYTLKPETRGDYNISATMRMRPALDPERLRRALERLAANHPMLRARFCEIDGVPMQRVHPAPIARVWIVDVANLDMPHVVARERAERTRPIDVETEPPFRATVYCTGPNENVLCLVFDHLVCDGWSLFQLTQELGTLLETGQPETNAGSSTVKSDYLDYVAHERQWLSTPRAAKQLEYWRTVLGSARPGVDLRRDYHPADDSRQRDSCELILSGETRSALIELAERNKTTLFVTLMAAYALLLHRLSGEADVSVGSVLPTRRDAWKHTTGNFVNAVVMPVRITEDMTLPELLKSLHELSFRALKNKEYPFDELIERVKPEGSNRGSAYFKAFYAFQKARHAPHMAPLIAHSRALGPTQWGGMTVEVFGDYLASGSGGQDLTLETCDFGECIFSGWSYDARRFSRATIQGFADRWQSLLAAMVEDSGQLVSRLPWISMEERERVLVEWNAASEQRADTRFFHEQFEAHAVERPDALAVQYQSTRLSYAELNARANQLAEQLRRLGVKPDVRVGVCMERSVELIVAWLATLKTGGAFVPLDPAYPVERLRHMLQDSAPLVVLTNNDAHGRVLAFAQSQQLLNVDTDLQVGSAASFANVSASQLGLTPNNLAYVIYTSGSTGTPKGVMIEHRGLSNLIAAQASVFELSPVSRVLQFASPSFDASVWEVVMALGHGASLHLAPRAELMPGRPLLETLAREQITHVTLPPSALPQCEDRDVPFTPKTLIVAGEAIRASEARNWAARVQLFNAYGPTEATVCATIHRCVEDSEVVPIGRPIANARIYILDKAGQPAAVGQPGEIYIGGVPVGRGYLNRAELTAERFVRDPFRTDPDARMYKTGDQARWLRDGTIEHLGRNDAQVKLRGFRIELDEIVAALSTAKGVSDVVVIVREDEPNSKRLVAYYTGAASPAADALRAYAATKLPDYMVPAAYVRLAALPLTPNGKVDRKALAAPGETAYVSRAYEAPIGPVETAIASIWADLLKRTHIGRQDDFFELGGHSLQVVELVSRVQRELNMKVQIRDLFSRPMLAHFAAAASRGARRQRSQSNLVALRPRGRLRPLFGVHPIGGTVDYLRRLACKLDPQLPLFGLQASGWDCEALAADVSTSIPEIAARYVAALRRVQPRGPYRLLGYSIGGVIAHAMAEVLLEQRQSVEFLGVIDSHPNLGITRDFIAAVDRMNAAEREAGPDAADQLFVQEALRYVEPTHALPLDGEEARPALRVMRATMKALCHYRPRRLPIRVTLFAATEDVSFDLCEEWATFMGGRVRTIHVAGSHSTLIHPQYIDGLATAITSTLPPQRRPLRSRHSSVHAHLTSRTASKVEGHARTVA